jgi:hypothetical protein
MYDTYSALTYNGIVMFIVHAGASGVGGAEGEIAENAFFSGESKGAAGWCFGSSEDDAIGGDVDVWGGVRSVGGCGVWSGVVSLRRGHANLLCIFPIVTNVNSRRRDQTTGTSIWHMRHTSTSLLHLVHP